MKTYLVTYSLNSYTQYYEPLSERLKRFPRWAKIFPRTWIIRSSIPIERIRNILSNRIKGEGQILVVEVSNSKWAAFNVDEDVAEWMKKNV
jgi:hypothetical protein